MAKRYVGPSAWRAAVCLATLGAAGCENADGGGDPQLMDATSPASSVDAGLRDTGVMDAQVADASRKQPRSCYSPVAIPPERSALAKQPDAVGCQCIPGESTAYCLDSTAILCLPSKAWQIVLDGPCFPTRAPDPVGSCQKLGGVEVERGAKCPSGFATRYGFSRRSTEDAGVGEYEDCCYPIEVPAQNCTQAGLKVEPRGTQSSLLATTCGDAGALRAFVVGGPSPSLCCTGTP